MALNKKIIQENGIESNYHKIGCVTLSVTDDYINLSVDMVSYLNEEYRKTNKYNDHKCYNFVLQNGEDTASQIRPLAYAKIKELPEWSDAEDC